MILSKVSRTILLAIALVPSIASGALAGGPEYSVFSLAPALLRDAASVVRRHDAVLTFSRPDRYTYSVHRVVTILAPAAVEEAQLVVHSSSLQKIDDLSAKVYDATGKSIRTLHAADWRDVSATDEATFLDDSRARVLDVRQPNYPYTVELAYTITSSNPLFLPDWQPQHDWKQSVESASFELRHVPSQPVRWQESHLPAGVSARDSITGGLQLKQWTMHNLAALQEEPLAPPLDELAPAVWCAPTTFSVQGHSGDQATWADFGKWYYQLNAGRNALPDALQAEMAALRTSEPDPYRRAQRVYERVQHSTRYVSIQLGIGGWQTIPATEVARTGYGDCKALTNYTCALLGAAGLPALPALVRAGERAPALHPEWVAPQFNHVILCLPLPQNGKAKADTVWLECTSATQPFAAPGDFTANRLALLILPTGGKLVRTPTLDATTSTRRRRLTMTLASTGAATASVRTRRTGALGDDYAQLLPLTATDQRRIITESLPSATPVTLGKLRLAAAPATAAGAVVHEELELTLPAAAARAGTRLRLPLNLLSRWTSAQADSARQAPLWLHDATGYADSVVVLLPAGVKVESVPSPTEVSSAFGAYRSVVTSSPDGTSLTYCRTLQTRGGHFPANDYHQYVAFSEKIARADRQQATLLLPSPPAAETH